MPIEELPQRNKHFFLEKEIYDRFNDLKLDLEKEKKLVYPTHQIPNYINRYNVVPLCLFCSSVWASKKTMPGVINTI